MESLLTAEQKSIQSKNDYETAYALQQEKAGFERDMGWFGKYCFPKALSLNSSLLKQERYCPVDRLGTQ